VTEYQFNLEGCNLNFKLEIDVKEFLDLNIIFGEK